MGWLDEHRENKEKHQYEQALNSWQIQLSNINDCIDLAKTYSGEATTAIVLQNSERLYFSVANTGLIEARLGPGHWQGASSGISVPIGDIGHNAIRYHVGSSKGTYAFKARPLIAS